MALKLGEGEDALRDYEVPHFARSIQPDQEDSILSLVTGSAPAHLSDEHRRVIHKKISEAMANVNATKTLEAVLARQTMRRQPLCRRRSAIQALPSWAGAESGHAAGDRASSADSDTASAAREGSSDAVTAARGAQRRATEGEVALKAAIPTWLTAAPQKLRAAVKAARKHGVGAAEVEPAEKKRLRRERRRRWRLPSGAPFQEHALRAGRQ